MTKSPSSFQRNIISTALICFTVLIRFCGARNSFENLDLSTQTLNPGVTGFMLTGNAASDYFGFKVSTAGDVNKDGYDDIIVGAFNKNSNQGAAYVFYGGEESSFLDIDLSTTSLNPLTTGFMMKGNAAGDQFGVSVSAAGDIDNDGYADIIIGAYQKDSNRGAAYVIYGGAKSTMSNWDFSSGATLNPLTTGFLITGKVAGGFLGRQVSTAGDINNDGYDDIIVPAYYEDSQQGAVYVIYGGPKSTMSNIALSSTTLNPTSTGFKITGNAAGDNFGYFVSPAGDINNDGYDDIIIGAYGKNSNQGAAYVIYGGPKSSMSNIVLSSTTLDPLTTGFMITGNAASDQFGFSVSTAGDINNDGYDDIIISAPSRNSQQGAAYVIYGGSKSTRSHIDLSSTTLDPATTGFILTGNTGNDYFGYSVSTAGDINNDGYDDIIIGAHVKNTAYVIYGGSKSTMSNIALSSTTLDPILTGFTITGNAAGNQLGVSVSTAGDINNDGYDDIIVGANLKNVAYVIYASCSAHCKQCYSDSICSECKNSYLMYQYGCYDPCPDTTLATSLTTCGDCPTRCKHCSTTSVCTECLSPFVLYDTQCLTSCPITMFSSNKVCKSRKISLFSPSLILSLIDCPSHCLSCASQDSCQVCFKGYALSNSLCTLSSDSTQQKVLKAVSSATQGIGSVVSVGSSVFPFSVLVAKIVQNTRYLNLSVTSELAEVYQTWDTDLISWDVPNLMSDLDHFDTSPYLFSQYDLGSPFLVNFWPTLINIAIGFGTFVACFSIQKIFEHEKYEGWAYSLVLKLVAGSFNFALIQAYACLDDILFYLVLDAKTNPFNSFFSWTSIICAVLFLVLGCLQVFFNFWTVYKYQSIKNQATNQIEAFNERNKYWALFYSDFNDDDLWSQAFFAIAIIRSALSSFIFTIFYDYPLLQTSYFLIMDGAIILFLYFKTPFNTLRGTLAQYYYEITTFLVHICASIIALQDSFESSSETVRNIMSTGILYLNTALICGAIGFMFIEIYKTISEKKRAARLKKRPTFPEDHQETQNLTQTVSPFHPSETAAHPRPDAINQEETKPIEKFHFLPENNPTFMESNFNVDHSRELDKYPSHRILSKNDDQVQRRQESINQNDPQSIEKFYYSFPENNQQRNQNTRPIMIRHRQQGDNSRYPNHAINHVEFPNN